MSGEQFDDPNREAVGLPPIHSGGEGDPDPEPEPEPETVKKSKKADTEEE